MNDTTHSDVAKLLTAVRQGLVHEDRLVQWLANQLPEGQEALWESAVRDGLVPPTGLRETAEPSSARLSGAAGVENATQPERPGARSGSPERTRPNRDFVSRDRLETTCTAASLIADPDARVELPPAEGQRPFSSGGRLLASGRYELGGELGRGGMGVVTMARDRAIGRTVAIKMLGEGDEDPNFLRALVREAQTTGQLDHPGILPVHELSVGEDGPAYYAMKMVSGVSLADVLRELKRGNPTISKKYTLTRRIRVLQRVCMAVHYAHSRGVVHRDLKPSNILLGEFGEVHVVDWGIAVLTGAPYPIGAGDGLMGTSPATERLAGTPRYMSPEQASGNLDALDLRADVFSLGIILFELATLNLPLDEPDVSIYLRRLLAEDLPPPSTRVRRRRVPPELERIVMRAIARDRRQRHDRALDLWQDLEEFLEGRMERDRRRQEAGHAFLEGRAAAVRFRDQALQREQLGEELGRARRALGPWAPREERERWERAAFRHENLGVLAAEAFSDAARHLQRAAAADPESAEITAALARLYERRLERAELAQDLVDMAFFGSMAQRLAASESDQRPGVVRVRTFPDGARVSVIGAAELRDDVDATAGRSLGMAPLHDIELAPGIWVLIARKPGYRSARLPLYVRPTSRQNALIALRPWDADVPLVGRSGELAQLRAMFESAAELGHARLNVIVGEAGSGRTRLHDAFRAYLEERRDPVIFAFVHCLPLNRGVPYHALEDVIRFRCGVRPGDAPEEIRRRLLDTVKESWGAPDQEGGPTLRQMEETADVLLQLPGLCLETSGSRLAAASDPARLEDALTEFLVRTAAQTPTALLFKDMHWMDGASRRVLERILDRFPVSAEGDGAAPIFILGSAAADGERGRLGPRRMPGGHPRIFLPPLTRAATAQLLGELLGGRAHNDLVARVHDSSHGNPYLIGAIARFLLDGDRLAWRGGEWRTLPGATAELSHAEVGHFTAERLARLPKRELAAVAAGAVLGRHFWQEAVAALGVDDAAAALGRLCEKDLLYERPYPRYPGLSELGFGQEVVWRTAYQSLSPSERRRLHGRAVDWLERRPGGGFYRRALLAAQLVPAGETERAATLHAELAREAAALGAHDEALHHWDRALSLPLTTAQRTEYRAARASSLG